MSATEQCWVIERDDGEVMQRFPNRAEAERIYATDLYDRSEYRLTQRWLPAIPEPLWVGWRLRKARCQCGRTFTGLADYRLHWAATHSEPWPDGGEGST